MDEVNDSDSDSDSDSPNEKVTKEQLDLLRHALEIPQEQLTRMEQAALKRLARRREILARRIQRREKK